jgi:hypothetical protein
MIENQLLKKKEEREKRRLEALQGERKPSALDKFYARKEKRMRNL